jgi:hypothetical protein
MVVHSNWEDSVELSKEKVNALANYAMAGMMESLANTLLKVQKEMQAMKREKEEKAKKVAFQQVDFRQTCQERAHADSQKFSYNGYPPE